MIELVELLAAGIYIVRAMRHRQHLSSAFAGAAAIALLVDIIFLHGRKTHGEWLLFNVPFFLFIYEKLVRKSVLRVLRELAILGALCDD